MTQWYTQAVQIPNNLKVEVNFTLPGRSTTNAVKWKFHVDDSANVRYDIILGRNILTEIGLNLKFSDHVIE